MDWYQIAGTTVAAIAAVSSAVTAYYTKKTNDRLIEERHALIKPIFRVSSIIENKIERVIKLDIRNVGYKIYRGEIGTAWRGNHDVKVSVHDISNLLNELEQHELTVYFDYSEQEALNDISGYLILSYTDLLGKYYREVLNINVKYMYNEISDEYLPILESVMGEYFR